MARPPLARERVLDAYESILIREGERAATLDAVAKAAGVSKGGLLYHFASKDDLATALVARLESLTDDDLERMRAADEGPVAYYVRTSVMEDDALDRALIATTRLAQGGSPVASAALRRERARWAEVIRGHVRDEASLDLVMLLSDGLYFNNSLAEAGQEPGGFGEFVPSGAALERLVALVVERTARTPQDAESAPSDKG
ncbi:TetR/AcrR family transcriptional regulator [Microbacterium sp. YJN-G]|uniref:TetR/AcrR family transcriptional regulator n=1 Tax=Microbacterium sp. YJN-G TaxID=2763257 RepID=UPI001877DBC4|nr:TetR/AcrR family transcriptional regulator [Microbacterium sp. YJN-G]